MQVALVIFSSPPPPSPPQLSSPLHNRQKSKKKINKMKRVSPKFIHIDRLTDCRRRRRLWRLLALPRPPAPHSLRSAVSVGSTCLHVFVTHVYLHEKEITPHTWPEQADSPSSPPSARHTHLSLCNQIVRKGMKSYFYTWAHTRSRHCLGEVRSL